MKAREPLQHFLGFLMKPVQDELSSGTHLAILASGKAREIAQGFSDALGDAAWFSGLKDMAPLGWVSRFIQLAVELIDHHAVAFHRRTVVLATTSCF
eukprot:7457706-Lingulodinium_polyedra.AAC.1